MTMSNNQNLRFDGGFSVAGKPALSRAFLRRRCNPISGMKHAMASMGAIHPHVSDKPSGLPKTPTIRNSDPVSDKAISIFEGFMRSNENKISYAFRRRGWIGMKII